MIVLLFIALAINYVLMPLLFMLPDLNEWGALYVVLVPRVVWFFAILASGVFWLNIIGLICFYAPLLKFYV